MARKRLPINLNSYSHGERMIIAELIVLYFIDRRSIPCAQTRLSGKYHLVLIDWAVPMIDQFFNETRLGGILPDVSFQKIWLSSTVYRFCESKILYPDASKSKLVLTAKGRRFIKRQSNHIRTAAIKLVCGPLDRLAMSL